MRVTHELILNGMSDKGGWNAKQIQLLGLEWPPQNGWHKTVIGRHISDEDAKTFVELKGVSCRKERLRKLREKPKNPVREDAEISGKTYVVYSDGGSLRPRGIGAWSYVVMKGGIILSEKSNSYRKTTGNRMELLGAIAGVTATPEGETVIVRSDSQYVVKGVELKWAERWAKNNFRMGDPKKGGKRPNWDLWMQLLTACSLRKVHFQWVKGHNGDRINEKCDRLATHAMKTGPHSEDVVFAKLLQENNGKW